MTENEQKAFELVQEAEKKLNTPEGFLGGLFAKLPKQYEALQSFGQACVLFKMEQKWVEAGNTFVKMAQIHEGLGNKDDCATNYVNAAYCFKATQPSAAVNSFIKAIDVYKAMKRFTIAAKYHQTIAEIYEDEISAVRQSAQLRNRSLFQYQQKPQPLATTPAQYHYQQAVDYLKGEESSASFQKCVKKVQEYKAKQETSNRARKVIATLPEEEVEFVKECFQKADLNGDGSASADELKKCFEDIDGEMIDYYIRLSDMNLNGTVEMEEAIEMYAYLTNKKEPNKELIRQMFLGLDKNQDGTISAYELSLFCKLFKPKQSEHEGMSFSELLNHLDTNGDGKVDYNEFVENYFHLL